MEPNDNPNLFNTMLEAAIGLHEMFTSLVQAGFNEAQALYIVAQVFRPKDTN